jgi:hypothetical protein
VLRRALEHHTRSKDVRRHTLSLQQENTQLDLRAYIIHVGCSPNKSGASAFVPRRARSLDQAPAILDQAVGVALVGHALEGARRSHFALEPVGRALAVVRCRP